jgi:hypothetical protein
MPISWGVLPFRTTYQLLGGGRGVAVGGAARVPMISTSSEVVLGTALDLRIDDRGGADSLLASLECPGLLFRGVGAVVWTRRGACEGSLGSRSGSANLQLFKAGIHPYNGTGKLPYEAG